MRELAKQKHIKLLIAVILLLPLTLIGFYLFGFVTFGNNLLSELIGIIATLLIIGWLLERMQEKQDLPYKKALLNQIQYHCNIILLSVLGEDLLLFTGDRLDPDEQIEECRKELEELYYLGKGIISTEMAVLLYEIILLVTRYLFYKKVGELSICYDEGLSFAKNIRTLFQLLEAPDYLVRTAEDAIERLGIYLEQEEALDRM